MPNLAIGSYLTLLYQWRSRTGIDYVAITLNFMTEVGQRRRKAESRAKVNKCIWNVRNDLFCLPSAPLTIGRRNGDQAGGSVPDGCDFGLVGWSGCCEKTLLHRER